MKLVTIRPESQREYQIANVFGKTNWSVVEENDNVICLGTAGVLIEKDKHMRWIRKEQVKEQSDDS